MSAGDERLRAAMVALLLESDAVCAVCHGKKSAGFHQATAVLEARLRDLIEPAPVTDEGQA